MIDVLGRRVATLADGPLPAGDHSLTWAATGAAPGLYAVRLRAGAQADVQTVTVVR